MIYGTLLVANELNKRKGGFTDSRKWESQETASGEAASGSTRDAVRHVYSPRPSLFITNICFLLGTGLHQRGETFLLPC